MKKTHLLVLALIMAVIVLVSGCTRWNTPVATPTHSPIPTQSPTHMPTQSPTMAPSLVPTQSPGTLPNASPTSHQGTASPTNHIGTPEPTISATPAVTAKPSGSNKSNDAAAANVNAEVKPETSTIQKVSDALVKLDGIDGATVIFSGNTALIGITLVKGTEWSSTLEQEIWRKAMESDPRITKCAATCDQQKVDRIKTLANDIRSNKDNALIAKDYDTLVAEITA